MESRPGLRSLANALPARWMLVLFLVGAGAGEGRAGSNLDPDGYPPHHCGVKPDQPERPEVFTSESELDSYNAAVDQYNQGMEAYFECIQTYVNNAASDIELIKRKTKTTIEEANN